MPLRLAMPMMGSLGQDSVRVLLGVFSTQLGLNKKVTLFRHLQELKTSHFFVTRGKQKRHASSSLTRIKNITPFVTHGKQKRHTFSSLIGIKNVIIICHSRETKMSHFFVTETVSRLTF